MNPRSYLYVPGVGGRLARAHERGADAVIADLEDGVAGSHLVAAVEAVRAWLRERVDDGVQRWVRVNPGEQGCADLRKVFGPGLDGVCVPKVREPIDIQLMIDAVRACRSRGREPAVMALVETAQALRRVDSIAAVPGLAVLQMGELDLSADLGLTPGPDELELLPARAAVVSASAAAGLWAPVAAVSPNYLDLDRFAVTTATAKRLGFAGRAVIHPAQVGPVHEAFTPSADEVARAVDVLRRYESALAEGNGVAVDASGAMIDEAVARSYRRVLGSVR